MHFLISNILFYNVLLVAFFRISLLSSIPCPLYTYRMLLFRLHISFLFISSVFFAFRSLIFIIIFYLIGAFLWIYFGILSYVLFRRTLYLSTQLEASRSHSLFLSVALAMRIFLLLLHLFVNRTFFMLCYHSGGATTVAIVIAAISLCACRRRYGCERFFFTSSVFAIAIVVSNSPCCDIGKERKNTRKFLFLFVNSVGLLRSTYIPYHLTAI